MVGLSASGFLLLSTAISLLSAAPAPLPEFDDYQRIRSRALLAPPNAARAPQSTPVYVPPPPPVILPVASLIPFLGGARGFKSGSPLASLFQPVRNPLSILAQPVDRRTIAVDKRAQVCTIFGIVICKTTTTAKTTSTTAKTTSTTAKTTSTTAKTTSTTSSTKTTSTTSSKTCARLFATPSQTCIEITLPSFSAADLSSCVFCRSTSTTSSTSKTSTSSTSTSTTSTSSTTTSVPSTITTLPPSTTTTTPTSTSSTTIASPSPTCLPSNATDVEINSMFASGTIAIVLCPNTVYLTSNPIIFTASNQSITTQGSPTDGSRAILRATGVNQTNIITGNCAFCDGLSISSIQVDGARPSLGFVPNSVNGNALIEMGGTTHNQVITNVHAYNTRGWSCAHAIEGTNLYCSGMTITNNQFGPCGMAPSAGEPQERKRQASSGTPPYQWADGLSMACSNSIVSGNVITDATDGGIVLFGAQGSTITGNTIVAVNSQLMGGINAVDYGPTSGSYLGTVVTNNVVNAQSAFIKVGLALGTMTWGSYNTPGYRTFGGTFTNNQLTSGSTGYFGFGISAAGINSTVVTGNHFSNANFGGTPSSSCTSYTPPSPGPLYYDPATTVNMTLQAGFNGSTPIYFVICDGPSPQTITGYSA